MYNKCRKVFFWIGILLLFFLMDYPCPIQKIFGIPCPGCNMTTALYYLLHGNVKASLWYHAMLLPTLITIGLIFYFRNQKEKVKWILWIWVALMLLYYVYRMIYIFPQAPMVYDSKNFLKIFSEKLDFQNIRSIIQSNK